MNLYFVHAENLHYTEFVSHDFSGPSYDDGGFGEYVYAETPGKAKVMVFKAQRRNYDHLEYTDLRIKTLRKGLDCPAGIGDYYTDSLIAEIIGPEPEPEPCPQCGGGGWIYWTGTEPDPDDPRIPIAVPMGSQCPTCGGGGWV